MFEQRFERSHALNRQRSAPLADERRLYLIHCASQGMARSTVRLTAELLVAVEDRLRLAERPNSIISLQEVEEAGTRWASRRAIPPIRLRSDLSKQRFICHAVRWLTFMGRLQPTCTPAKPHEEKVVEFADFMLRERGLSPATIALRCQTVCQLLDQLCDGGRSLNDVTVSEIDSILTARVNEAHNVRASVQTCASSLRSFFRFAETRKWCKKGIAASIMAPRVFQQESLPSAPSWFEVQKLLSSMDKKRWTYRLKKAHGYSATSATETDFFAASGWPSWKAIIKESVATRREVIVEVRGGDMAASFMEGGAGAGDSFEDV